MTADERAKHTGGTRARSSAGFDLDPPGDAQRRALEERLNPEERRVLLHHGTEAPFCGALTDRKEAGTYCCKLCGLPLFVSATKFDSGTGWPSFTSPFDSEHLHSVTDNSLGMSRVEIRCARCEAHHGHVFPDGPPPTGLRYCINSVSLEFVPAAAPLPDRLDRGNPEGTIRA